MALTHVLTPIQVGPVHLRNRVARTAHGTRLALYSFDDLTEFHLRRAEGGVGLTILEIIGVHRTTPASLNVFNPVHAEGYPRMMEKLRPTGMKVFQQLWHGGHHSLPIDGSPPWSASDQPSPEAGVVPIAMTKAMIDEIIEAYAHTAKKCEEWGLDGVELHAAHGYLPQQFLSTNTNKREDDYGGSFENRARFTLECLAAIRSRVSKDFAVGVRLAPDDAAGGFGVEDNARLLELIESKGLADLFNVSLGSYQAFPRLVAGMHEPMGYELPTSVPVTRRAKQVPTLVTGRFRTLEEADAVIRAGDASIVALSRAHIADPDLVKKTMAGHPERVRPCIGCNQGCLAGSRGPSARVACTVNAGAGWERTSGDHMLKPVPTPKRVLVIGGGPAGMEAARAAATRGHKVTLVEAEPELGGRVKIACRAPTRATMRDAIVWLEQEVYRLGVEVRLSTYMDADDVLKEGADEVIVTTGSSPRMDGIQVTNPGEPISGLEQPHVLSSWDVFQDERRIVGKSALVIDDTGHFEAIAVAETLQARGMAVTFVTRHISFAPLVEMAAMCEPALARLSARGNFAFHSRWRAVSIGKADAVIAPTFIKLDAAKPGQLVTVPAETVVFVSPNRANREIYNALSAKGMKVRVAGDANSPRYLNIAIREGHLAGAGV
jgi:2,4-dienoyl-CoA reductase-like NADH-dependent reductase (Old Yellow Enzyme family)